MATAKSPAKKPSHSPALARAKQARIAASGKTTRAKGHLSATTRRSQAKRDGK